MNTKTSHDQSLLILEQTPALLGNLMKGVNAEDLEWQPSPKRWSISMVIAHLADVEQKGFRSRFEAMSSQEEPFLPSYDPLALFQSSATFDAHAELTAFKDLRAANLQFLRGLPPETFTRTGKQDFGIISMQQLLNEFAFHDLGHTRQIMELYRSHAFYPNIGSFQSIYSINP